MASTSSRASRTRSAALLAAGSVLALAAFAPAAFAAASNGSIWTTAGNCESPNPQDQNSYAVGDPVVIRGTGFDAGQEGTYEIKGQPGNASSDPGVTVASGDVKADENGDFCVEAYVVQPGDEGEYTVDALDKNDNYGVEAVESSAAPSASPSVVPTPTPTPTPTPSGGAGGETAAASLPPTDRTGSSGTPEGLGLVLMALAGVLAAAMVLTPARSARRR